MRKMWSSGNTACSVLFSSIADVEVAAERLLDHDAAAVVEADRGELVGDRREHRRRDRHVEHGQLRLVPCRACRASSFHVASVGVVALDEVHPFAQLVDHGRVGVVDVLDDRLAGRASRKSSSVQSLRATPITGTWSAPRRSQPVERREQLALGEVAGGAEQHEGVGVGLVGVDLGRAVDRGRTFIAWTPFVRGGRRSRRAWPTAPCRPRRPGPARRSVRTARPTAPGPARPRRSRR